MNRLTDWLIARAKRTPYFHLYHADGSLYMERYWLVPFKRQGGAEKEGCYNASWYKQPLIWLCQRFGVSVRIHVIHTPDFDRHLHDHPWTFISRVLRGWYTEVRPIGERPSFDTTGREFAYVVVRRCGDWARRTVFDRHRIDRVSPGGVTTLFITGPKLQSWGFFTERGWVPWEKYESVHNSTAIQGRDIRCAACSAKNGHAVLHPAPACER